VAGEGGMRGHDGILQAKGGGGRLPVSCRHAAHRTGTRRTGMTGRIRGPSLSS
jgi:hypothetical protein